jgi:hypothetical protein
MTDEVGDSTSSVRAFAYGSGIRSLEVSSDEPNCSVYRKVCGIFALMDFATSAALVFEYDIHNVELLASHLPIPLGMNVSPCSRHLSTASSRVRPLDMKRRTLEWETF